MRIFLFLIALLTAFPAYAVTHPDEQFDDPVLAARADNIARQIRCVVCQNQSIYDSDTEIAQGLRTLIAVQLKEGKTNGEIIDYIHERYGDFVLMKPPIKPMTWGLWFGPILILLSGGLLVMRMMKVKKRRRRS